MKQYFFYPLVLFFLVWGTQTSAQTPGYSKNVTDYIDVMHYDLVLDMGHQYENQLAGCATLYFWLLAPVDSVELSLVASQVDSVFLDQQSVGYSFRARSLYVNTSFVPVGNIVTCRIYYRSNGHVEPYGFGGLHFDPTLYYNLGVAFDDNPHNYGKVLFPCRDNFHDKATYTVHATAPIGWTTQCSGMLDSVVINNDGSQTTHWRLDQPISTYLLGIAMANFHTVERDVQGVYGSYPVTVAFRTEDSLQVATYFELLDDVVPMFERCFGPYRWGRIGYVGTTKGSMEHATNIALVNGCIAAINHELCQSTTSHELGHAWFGNLITCETADEMWFNEGGATFTSEVAIEALFGKDYANDFYQSSLESVFRTTHRKDGGYYPLQGQSHANVYGSTTYDKGGMVWHSLRGYLGDSLFYATMQQLFLRNAFTSMNAIAIRDSLSLYSGTDLTDFFDFHVFGPGFQDFYVESMHSGRQGNIYQTTVELRQKLVHAPQYANSNRIPLTFVGGQNQRHTCLATFDGASATLTFQLPFEPKIVLIDFDRTFSDAVTSNEIVLAPNASVVTDEVIHFKTLPATLSDTARLFVELHWSDPDLDGNPGIVRTSHHYWVVQGLVPDSSVLRGYFGYGSSGQFDEDLMYGSSSRDSVRLLYRRDSHSPWQVVNSSVANGYLLCKNISMGEFTVAIVDENQLEVPTPISSTAKVKIFPCPSRDGITVDIEGYQGKVDVNIFDIGGRQVAHFQDQTVGQYVPLNLPSGTYVVTVSDRFHTFKYVQRLLIKIF